MKNPLNIKPLKYLAAALALSASVLTSKAQVTVYSDNFDVDNTANWITNVTGVGWSFADFYFDYSTVGIPSAPNSTGGSTRGMKLAANLGSAGVFPAGISVSPTNFGITVNFELRFDMWMNYVKSGNGSTEVGGAGYGTAGTSAQVAGVADSVFIGATTDGGSTADYRVYGPAVAASYQDADHIIQTDLNSPLVYTAGSRNNTATYYVTNFPAQPVPPAQTNLFPSQTATIAPAGSISFKWHDVKLRKVGTAITYFIDDILIATVDSTDAGTLGGTNIHFNFYDINAGGSTDVTATNLLFALYDNVRVTDFTNVVTVSTTVTPTKEGAGTPGVFTLTRSAAGVPLTINYTMSGTATNNVDFTNLVGSVTFDAADTTTNIFIDPIDDLVSEVTETVVFNITPNTNYVSGGSATLLIEDNDANILQIVSTNTAPQMYERTNDFCAFRVVRLGDLATTYNVNLAFTGTAVDGTDFYLPVTVTMDGGSGTKNFIISPIEDADYESSETVVCSLAASVDYVIGVTNSVTATIVNSTLYPETALFSDNFDSDSISSGAWTLFTTDTNGPTADFGATAGTDYSAFGIPAAPHGSGTLGLVVTANKSDLTATAAALNLYPTNQSFSGNYALRFDMFLSAVPGATATEHVLFGINQSGAKTNWYRGSAGGVLNTNWSFDGIFCGVGADASGSAPGDYGFYSSPTTTNSAPTALATAAGSGFTSIYKNPPYAVAGSPANNVGNFTPIWADVEISKIGNVVTLWINNTRILNITNSTYTSGNIMLGYVDPYDSIGANTSYAVYDNVRVVSIAPPVITLQPVNSTNNVGSSATFTAAATTSTTITNYQWFKNGVAISGATNSSYTDASVAVADYGSYRVEVNDGRYTTVSSTAVLSSPGLSIVTQPNSIVLAVNIATNFTVGVGGTSTGVTNYQWQRSSTNLTGSITNPLNFTVRSTNYGPYRVIVNDGFLSVTSAVANLTPPAPLINVQPSSRAALVGSSPTLSVTATSFSGVTNFQWMYYGTNVSGTGISGATTRILTLAGIQPVSFNGPFTVRVNDGFVNVTSTPAATITVPVSPTNTSPAINGSNLVFGHSSQTGPNYIVDFKSALTNATWTAIKTNAGTGSLISVTNAMSGDQGYFRIRLQ